MGRLKRGIAGLLVALCLLEIFPNTVSAASVENQVSTEEEEKTEVEKKEEEQKKLMEETYNSPVQSNEVTGWPKGPRTYGSSAIIMEAESGAILYEKNIDQEEYPASITKILTALLALEHTEKLDEKVKITKECLDCLESGYACLDVKEGDILTMEQALYAMLLSSANEVSYAIGETVAQNEGGDYEDFIEMMNAKVKALGGHHSHFKNANGMHDTCHVTCARDMALIGKELFKYPEFFKICQTPSYKIEASDVVEEHEIYQKHRMMIRENENYYKYVIGGKTGYTPEAKNTLVTMADDGKMKLICVVMGTFPGHVYSDTKELLDYGFSNFHKVRIESPKNGFVILPLKEKGIDKVEKQKAYKRRDYYYKKMLVGSYPSKSIVLVKKDHAKGDSQKIVRESRKHSKYFQIAFASGIVIIVILFIFMIKSFLRARKRRIRRKKIQKAKKKAKKYLGRNKRR